MLCFGSKGLMNSVTFESCYKGYVPVIWTNEIGQNDETGNLSSTSSVNNY